MPAKKKRFTLDLDPEVHVRLKVAAALRGVSMRQYCLTAIEKELAKEEIPPAESPGFTKESFERLISLRDEIFQGRTLPGDSTELIREAREIRDKDLERLSGS